VSGFWRQVPEGERGGWLSSSTPYSLVRRRNLESRGTLFCEVRG
jgi:hypothetical protein